MLNKFLVGSVLAIGAGLLIPACASISESECQAGNWADLGYRDGVNGKARDRLADYVQTCSEYEGGLASNIDRSAYLSSYEAGLTHYCTYDKGFERGKDGSSYNTVCDGPDNSMRAEDFRAGYDDGYSEYELRNKYKKYESSIESKEDQVRDIEHRLSDTEETLDEKDRLTKKKKRILRELEELRWDFRGFKRKYDLDW